tara:strand:- start:4976 stop:5251 length:276 start_codon:yes stop_codon:yes gene_type:complete
MAKISTYGTITYTDINNLDTFLTTDYDNSNATKNVRIGDLIFYLNFNGANSVVPPATVTSPGVAGTFMITSNFLYVCYGADQWRRVALSAW